MPSIGQSAIATILAKPYTVEGGFNVQINVNGEFVQKLANAIHTGWTSATPTSPTTMAASFNTEFLNYLYTGLGKVFVECIASSIDAEVSAWVASWDDINKIHTFTVSNASIYNRIMTCSPYQSNGAKIFAQGAADAFMAGFGQEVG